MEVLSKSTEAFKIEITIRLDTGSQTSMETGELKREIESLGNRLGKAQDYL